MADDIDLDKLDTEIEQESRVEKRIKDLSEKVRTASEERDSYKKQIEEKEARLAEIEKERDFLNSFGTASQKYPDAVAFRDEIKERVLKGYTVDDAAVSVLNEKGKLFKEPEPAPEKTPEKTIERVQPAGGSAPTPPPSTGDKKIAEMTQEERRAALLEAEKRGDLGTT